MGKPRLLGQSLILGLAGLTTGCAGYAEYYAAIDTANSRAVEIESARFAALAQLAASEDEQTRMAATMALALSPAADETIVQPQVTRPIWLDVLQVTAGPLANLGIAGIQASVSKQQISANRDVSISTNEAFVGLGTAGISGVGAAGAAGAAAVRDTARAGLATIERITLEPTP